MEKIILTTKEYKILTDIMSKDKKRIFLQRIFILDGYLYSTDGMREVKIKKDDELLYPVDGSYEIKGKTKVSNIGYEVIIEKVEQEMPDLKRVSEGFNIEVFEKIINKSTFRSILPLTIYDILKKPINVDLIEVLYDICDEDKITVYITNNDTPEKPIMIKIERFNMEFIILPFEFNLPKRKD